MRGGQLIAPERIVFQSEVGPERPDNTVTTYTLSDAELEELRRKYPAPKDAKRPFSLSPRGERPTREEVEREIAAIEPAILEAIELEVAEHLPYREIAARYTVSDDATRLIASNYREREIEKREEEHEEMPAAHDTQVRSRAEEMIRSGLPRQQIVDELKIPLNTAHKWAREMRERGETVLKPPLGGARNAKYSPEQRAEVERLVRETDLTYPQIEMRTGINGKTVAAWGAPIRKAKMAQPSAEIALHGSAVAPSAPIERAQLLSVHLTDSPPQPGTFVELTPESQEAGKAPAELTEVERRHALLGAIHGGIDVDMTPEGIAAEVGCSVLQVFDTALKRGVWWHPVSLVWIDFRAALSALDRECRTCGGYAKWHKGQPDEIVCPSCDGTGRDVPWRAIDARAALMSAIDEGIDAGKSPEVIARQERCDVAAVLARADERDVEWDEDLEAWASRAISADVARMVEEAIRRERTDLRPDTPQDAEDTREADALRRAVRSDILNGIAPERIAELSHCAVERVLSVARGLGVSWHGSSWEGGDSLFEHMVREQTGPLCKAPQGAEDGRKDDVPWRESGRLASSGATFDDAIQWLEWCARAEVGDDFSASQLAYLVRPVAIEILRGR